MIDQSVVSWPPCAVDDDACQRHDHSNEPNQVGAVLLHREADFVVVRLGSGGQVDHRVESEADERDPDPHQRQHRRAGGDQDLEEVGHRPNLAGKASMMPLASMSAISRIWVWTLS